MYKKYKDFILPEHYREPYGIHGIGHVHRVLYLADKIAQAYDLTEKEQEIVALSCCYHDIGRVNNAKDDDHGMYSCEKIKKLGLLDKTDLNEHEKVLILRMIAGHCLKDRLFQGTDRECFLFKILKDADGLERVRIHDLNVIHLRLDASKELEVFAWQLLKRLNEKTLKNQYKVDLERFKRAQEYDYLIALEEVQNGEKRTHWMWYIFPQVAGLGRSRMAIQYAINNLREAKAYLADETLGNRLVKISNVLLGLETNDAQQVFGPVDAMKLRSCMTLFAYISEEGSVFHRVLEKYYNGEWDALTLEILSYA